MKKNTIKSNKYVAFGFDLNNFKPVEQVNVYRYLVNKVSSVAQRFGGDVACKVNIACGILQISLHGENIIQAVKDFATMQMSGDINIPGDGADTPIYKYMELGEGNPIWTMYSKVASNTENPNICLLYTSPSPRD